MPTAPLLTSPESNRPQLPVSSRNALLSAVAHGLAILAVVGIAAHHTPMLAAYKLPGTSQGTQLISYYSPGSPEHAVSTLAVKPVVQPVAKVQPPPAPALRPALAAPVKAQAPTLNAERGTGSAEQSGLGDGNISIALQKYFPYPRPDLSPLSHGARGDVILNAVIDEQGKIADLTLIQGLGPSIDNAVIATVKQWTYSPATKNGNPVRSEQELHFHYEKS